MTTSEIPTQSGQPKGSPTPWPTGPASSLAYEPFKAKRPLLQRINLRILIFIAIPIAIVGPILYLFLNEAITGGIHHYGNYSLIDLKAMSDFNMDQSNATLDDIPKKWRNLEGEEVVTIGEMWDAHAAGENKLSTFQTVYSISKCCFSGPPLAQHFVDCNVVPKAKVYYYNGPVKVWGKIHVRIRKDGGVIKSIYEIDVEKVEPDEG